MFSFNQEKHWFHVHINPTNLDHTKNQLLNLSKSTSGMKKKKKLSIFKYYLDTKKKVIALTYSRKNQSVSQNQLKTTKKNLLLVTYY